MGPAQLIAYLNALRVGELDLIGAKLDLARRACLDLEQTALAQELDEAGTALKSGDLRTYRRRVEKVVSQLGHLK